MAKANHECAPTRTDSVICCPLEARWTSRAPRSEPMGPQNARRNYERYLTLARAENGNTVGAENYYQYAEHYFRSMSSDREGT
jgi:hypothetical protein